MSASGRLFRSRWLRALLLVLALFAGWLGISAFRIAGSVAPFVSADRAKLPSARVALVLGCSQRMADGRTNLFFSRRMQAAAELFRAGQVQYLLLSGDNSRVGYDEPSDMRRALVAAGVPASRIVLDYAGFRTLDSVVRAKQVFGLHEIIVVSQRFHGERAVYLARAHGISAWAYAAADVGGPEGLRVRLREVISRMAAVLDVRVLHTTPRFPGPPEVEPFP